MATDRRTATPTELKSLLIDYCRRIEQYNELIRAIVPGSYAREQILTRAEKLLEEWPDPVHRPPLFGLTLGVKDIIHVDGFSTGCGTALPPHLFQGQQADCVSKLLHAGAIVMGKTETTEFAFLDPAATRNPHNINHTPGGSSSGSAAGVAKGMFDLALGTQTVGSVIRPAAYCGVIGFKPSTGRIATSGVVPFSASVDQVGLFCTDIDLLQPVSAVLLDRWNPNDSAFQPQESVLGIPEGPYLDQASSNGLAQFYLTVDKLHSAGISIKRCRALADIEQIDEVHRRLISAEMARVHQAWMPKYGPSYRPLTRSLIESGLEIDNAELQSLRLEWKGNAVSVAAEMKTLGIDYWVAPAATDHADSGLQATGNPVMNLPWTHAGLPVVSLPTHLDDQHLPHGLQVVARPDADEQLLHACMVLATILSYPNAG
jgi:Asp-tRNA(Asn)/Glu-tRNA(Gln) amidotransferase A subunit family amidase|tara:strand:- start:5372 stop:6661 length:1290 start_codon:yes stop_codon:yes gene_type:complete